MPIRATAPHGPKSALCINCADTVMNMPNCRYTLAPDAGFAEEVPVKLFVAFCSQCGYAELYLDGYTFSSNKAGA
jgi:RNase P subunit RPR2